MQTTVPGRWRLRVAAIVLGTVCLAGCATPPIQGANPRLLEFLRDGTSTRDEVILALGQPSATFQQERILTYRLGEDATQGYFVEQPHSTSPWLGVRYSLVLVFDAGGTLQKHSLVPVQ
jgi:hypothetical protein